MWETPLILHNKMLLSGISNSQETMFDNIINFSSLVLQEVKGFLEYVNKIREREKAEPLTWNTAVKFLMARKFDKKRAIDLYINHEVRLGVFKLSCCFTCALLFFKFKVMNKAL